MYGMVGTHSAVSSKGSNRTNQTQSQSQQQRDEEDRISKLPFFRRVVSHVKQAWSDAKQSMDIEVEDIENPVYRRPRGLEQLAKATHFSKKELKRLYRDFKAAYPSGVIKEENFKAGYTQLFPKGASSSLYFRYVFNTFDKDSTGIVGFEDLVFVLSKLCRGSLEDKLRWTFRLYDTNNDNTISQQEMEDVISSVAFLTGLYDEEDIERRIKLWVESIFEKMDLNKDGVIDQDEFLSCCLQDENIHHSLTVFDDFIEDITI
ncbi:Kv channel-interacting protein 1-like isoform X3 [Artemia franciscana]|uniref:Kv channel-interacting protein 1-like isoform X3 n=1 Tax=Artemia franciscana TaxID=6661 RepID=UPI0032DB2437